MNYRTYCLWLAGFILASGSLGCSPMPSASPPHEETIVAAVTAKSEEHRERPPAVPSPEFARVSEFSKASDSTPVVPSKHREEEEETPMNSSQETEKKEKPPEEPPPMPKGLTPFPKGSKVLFFEKTADDKRRVYVLAEVCLREGQLEVFLCKKNTKEHESILNVDCDTRDIHFALIAAKAMPGSTVKFVPNYVPASGTPIKIAMTYHLNGKLRTDPAQYWIKDLKAKKEMSHNWVFAGSRFFKFPDEPDRQPFYCANNGEVISIANFPDSMLDLPVKSPRDQADLAFEAWTERIPPLKTKVLLTLEPLLGEKEKK